MSVRWNLAPEEAERRRNAIWRARHAGLTFPAIARIVGSTPNGVRGTYRKMLPPGSLPRKMGRPEL